MSLQLYRAPNDTQPISTNQSYVNAITWNVPQSSGGIFEQKFYLKSDIPLSEAFNAVQMFSSDTTAPDEHFWFSFASDVAGTAGVYTNPKDFGTITQNQVLPIWIKAQVPPGQPVATKTDIRIGVTFIQSTVDTIAPSTPQNLSLQSTTPTSATITWDVSTDNVGVQGYYIFKDGGSTAFATVANNIWTDPTVLQGETHSYIVKAFDAAGNISGASNSLNVTINTDNQPPSVPTNLVAVLS